MVLRQSGTRLMRYWYGLENPMFRTSESLVAVVAGLSAQRAFRQALLHDSRSYHRDG